MADERRTPTEEVRRLYEEAETRTARAMEEVVARDSFGELLGRMTENAVALTRIGSDSFDLVLRNLRLAGRQDVTRLARQLARTEDKLEMVLQEVERLADLLEEAGYGSRRTVRGSDAPAKPRRSTSGMRAAGGKGQSE